MNFFLFLIINWSDYSICEDWITVLYAKNKSTCKDKIIVTIKINTVVRTAGPKELTFHWYCSVIESATIKSVRSFLIRADKFVRFVRSNGLYARDLGSRLKFLYCWYLYLNISIVLYRVLALLLLLLLCNPFWSIPLAHFWFIHYEYYVII